MQTKKSLKCKMHQNQMIGSTFEKHESSVIPKLSSEMIGKELVI